MGCLQNNYLLEKHPDKRKKLMTKIINDFIIYLLV